MIRVLIVNDLKVILEKLRYVLQQASDMEVVGLAIDGVDALEKMEVLHPDVVLMDIEMPNLDGINATKIISRNFPNVKILILSAFDNEEYINQALKAGAQGYILTNIPDTEILNSVIFLVQGYSQIILPGTSRQLAEVNSGEANSSTSNSIRTNNSRSNSFETIEANSKNGLDLDSNNSALVTTSKSRNKPKPEKFSWKYLLCGWAVFNIGIWLCTLIYLILQPPTYPSQWSLVLPGEEQVDFKIPDMGEALSEGDNSVEDIDPRNNIVYLATNRSVLRKAAKKMNISPNKFGRPEIEVVSGTVMISFKIFGDSPTQARLKGRALHSSILETIELIKSNNLKDQKEAALLSVQNDRAKLEQLERKLDQRAIDSDLVSLEQVQILIGKLESLRSSRQDINRELDGLNRQISSISDSLRLSSQQAEDLLALQADAIFQNHLEQYNQVTANLTNLQSNFTAITPQVINEQIKQQEIQTALLTRGRSVINKPVDLQMLNRLRSSDEKSMTKNLVSTYNSQQILVTKKQTLDQQIQELDSRIKKFNQEKIPIQNLRREIKFAEAVLSSKMAKIDITTDSSPAFPNIQVLSKPSLPRKRDMSYIVKPLTGALAATFISTTGLGLLGWDRKAPWKI